MDAKEIGRTISTHRKALGLTQMQLAAQLQVSNRTVSKWENGDGFPDISLLPGLAAALDITIDELLTQALVCRALTGRVPPEEMET